ncbi:PAAR domain-containing protein [Pseudescherichia vulneris]|uniref:PAAR domain-containing protein n=1 Tax=Pseudescherichia vulneris TaxID=566 RepID=UPI00227D02C5|nr:PAAR domain-containing protein [Pseudescherichia vulneris]WAH53093.1 PAAR domain-containing protein [Pseudescherichia vulneris]
MPKRVVVLNDVTSHGGRVISVFSNFEIKGKNAALLNVTIFCPEHGSNAIVECDMSDVENGKGRRSA